MNEIVKMAIAQHNGNIRLKLRDEFATSVIPAVIVKCANDTLGRLESLEQMFARKAYKIADAMLAEREKDNA